MSTLPLMGPKFRAFDAAGDPLAGGKVYSYAAGTTTPLDTFTTRAGNIANANPVVLNANGEADVWTTTGVLYKFVLKDSLGVTQWTVDNVPSGTIEASTTSDLANSLDPGGRITLTSGSPVTTSDVTGATTVFYTPQNHNKVPLYDGSAWALSTVASELSQALSDATKSPAAATDDHAYDMFIWLDSGTLRLSRGPAWSSQTVRGSGAGTTEIERVSGRFVNKYAISNGPAAQKGLYVGSILVNAGNHGVNDSLASRHVWNTYNRVMRPMRVVEATASWTYSDGDNWRQANGNASNELNFFIGLTREPVCAEVLGRSASSSTTTEPLGVGIGLDSSTANSASNFVFVDPGAATTKTEVRAYYDGFPGLGRRALRWLEIGGTPGAAGGFATNTWYGANTFVGAARTFQVTASGIWGRTFG